MKRAITDFIYRATGIAMGRQELAFDRDAQLAVAAVLSLASGSDGGETTSETVRMLELLKDRFGLKGTEALELLSRGRERHAGQAAGDILGTLDRRLGLPAKEDLLLMLLTVIAADGAKDAAEFEVLEDAATALRVPDTVTERAYGKYFAARRNAGV
jgi:uncharacterized tellurite resistance protein B-like protein